MQRFFLLRVKFTIFSMVLLVSKILDNDLLNVNWNYDPWCSVVCFNHSLPVCFNCAMQLLNVLSAGAQQFCSVLITTHVFCLKSLAVKPIDSVFSFPTWGWTQLNNKRAEMIAWFYFTNARTYILYTMFGLLFTIKYILPFPIRIDNVLFLFFEDRQTAWLIF